MRNLFDSKMFTRPEKKKRPQINHTPLNHTVQTKLEIGKPDDKFERQADTVADKVMMMPEKEEEMMQPKHISSTLNETTIQRPPIEEKEEILQLKMLGNPVAESSGILGTLQKSKGNGSSLPNQVKYKMEQGIGMDFSNVNIHTDNSAIHMNRQLNAKAFTKRDDIYFNAGQFNPSNKSGQHLLAHELTHVAQQSGGQNNLSRKSENINSISAGNSNILQLRKGKKKKLTPEEEAGIAAIKEALNAQKKMWEDLKAFFPGSGHKLAGSGYDKNISYLKADFTEGNSGGVSTSAPIMIVGPSYVSETDNSVRKAKLKEEMEKVDKFRIEKGRISDADVADSYVNLLIDQLDKAGMQALLTKMKAQKYIANTDMVAHITGRIAMLAKIAAAKLDIITTFKVKSVIDGNKKWTLDELVTLKDALNMVPAADKSVLKGIDIRRVISLGGKTAGEFSHEVGEVATGAITFTQSRVIELADLAYKGGNKAETKRLIIHEIGHAIANKKSHNANVAVAEAMIEVNKRAAKTTDSFNRLTAANEILDPAVKALNDKIYEYNNEKDPVKRAAIKKQIPALRADYNSKKAVSNKVFKENEADLKAAKTAKTTLKSKKAIASSLKISAADLVIIKRSNDSAKTRHDAQLKATKTATGSLDKSDADIKSYHNAVFAVSAELDTFYTDTLAQDKSVTGVESSIKKINTEIRTRDTTRKALQVAKKGNDMITAFASLETAQAALFEAIKKHSLAKDRNKKVHEFAKFVEKHNIAPITTYAEDNWPLKPEEFYAEAYSFWVTGKLKAKSTKLNKWFDDGNYK